MKLTKRNYYSKKADTEYMSYSQFKAFDECPAKAMAILKGEYEREETEAMLVGSFVDAWLDGNAEFERFVLTHPQMFNSRTGELKVNFKLAQDICNIIKSDEYLYKQLKGRRQVLVTGKIAGVPFKGKIDSLKPDVIVDGKVLRNCEDTWKNGEKVPFYKANGYDIQGAIYKTIYKQKTGKDLPFRLAVVTKEKTPDKRIFEFSEETFDTALQEVIAKAPVFNDIKKGEVEAWGCGVCDYCKAKKRLSKEDIETL